MVVLALILGVVAWWPLIAAYPHTHAHDGFFFHKMLEVVRVSVSRYHELPLWNPYECGGVPLWDNPQGIGAAPLMWLTLLIGTTRTIAVWYVVHLAAGLVCMWLLARVELKLSMPASLVAAVSWTFAGVQACHFAGGHVVWVSYLYYPLALLFWRRAERDLWGAVGLGLIVALTVYEGGTYPLPYLALLLGTETLMRVWPPRRLPRIVLAAVVVVAVALSVGACRFLPVWDQLAHHHRELTPDLDYELWRTVKEIFLARVHDRRIEGQGYVFPEYWDYVGPIVLTLSAIGFFLVRSGERWLLVLFVFSFALQCGKFSEHAPWTLLNTYVYPFKQMRVPSRFVVMTTLFISVFLGFAVDRIPGLFRRLTTRKRQVLATSVVALALIGVGDEMSVFENRLTDARAWSVAAVDGPPQNLDATPRPRFYYGGQWATPFLDTPQMNAPDLGCWEEWAFHRGATLWQGDTPQARAYTANVKVGAVDRTPNTFTVEVNADGPGRILFNSTYDRGWRTDHGEVLDQTDTLAVDVPAGSYTLHVHYWPIGLTLGFFLSAASSALLLVLFVQSRRWKREVAAG